MITLIRQTDRRWADNYIPSTKCKIKDWGCAICSTCFVANYYGRNETPLTLKATFTSDGRIFWASVKDIKFDTKYDWTKEKANLSIINAYLENGIPLIISTMTGIFRKQEHFITLLGRDGDDYLCADPLKGFISFKKEYGDPIRWIYKCIIFKKA